MQAESRPVLRRTNADFHNEISLFNYWFRELTPILIDDDAQATKIQRRYRRNRWKWRRMRKQYRAALKATDVYLFPGIERLIERMIPISSSSKNH